MAASQLGSDKPPTVRLAGVYAMAGLADEWEANQQTCINVLCGYLRMPYEPDPGEEAPEAARLAFRASREVRHTLIRVITAHLKVGTGFWRGLDFDFTGVVFDGGDFSGAEFSGGQSFPTARFCSDWHGQLQQCRKFSGMSQLRSMPEFASSRSSSTAPCSRAAMSASRAPSSPAAPSTSTAPCSP